MSDPDLLDRIRSGVYRHWKGPLYQVLALGHDANDAERTVVVYFGLELEAAHTGPRLAVRTVEDFAASVHTEDGSTCLGEFCNRIVGRAFADRFTYLGPELTAEMIAERVAAVGAV